MATRGRGQTVVTQLGNRTTVQPAPQRSRSVASRATTIGVRSPQTLARIISENSRRTTQLETRALADIFGNCVLLRNIVANANPTVTYIQHRLGRPYTGYFVTRTQGNSVMGLAIERTLPSNMSNTVWIALLFQLGATVDLVVF